GDSLTEAFQVEENESYSQLLESNLKNYFKDKNFEVLNMGIAGYGTEREYYVFKNKGLKFNPDIILLGFFTGNDFSDNMRENVNPEASFSKSRDIKNKIKLFFRNHSTAWRFMLRMKSHNNILAYFKNINKKEPNQEFGQREGQTEIEAQTDRSTSLIKNFQKLANENSVDLVVAVLPPFGQVFGKDENIDELHRGLLSFLKKEQINHVDLLPYFKKWAKLNPGEPPYLITDGHPSKYGQRIIADGISNFLTNFINH
ncbi:MAG: SGNH/GDSL hydrolase family protein, partial [Candidatus Yanofskybacteria bacterium]|nr:SGNH/GDSL hydrolase family protein [Candidatus Yanofskybacteria bacterium]